MKTCIKCSKNVRSDYQFDICKVCRSVCGCGNKKDWRAIHCRSCGSRIGATLQWQKMRPAMIEGIRRFSAKRSIRFEDLNDASFREAKPDGRKFARYRDAGGKLKAIYRYQWVWIKHRGAIPQGMIIHHIDEVCYHDEIDNLQLMTPKAHMQLHGELMEKAKWVCQHCGIVFAKSPRGKTRVRKFCSQHCHYEYVRNLPDGQGTTCHTVKPADEFTAQMI